MRKLGFIFSIAVLTFTQCTVGPSRQELITSNDSLQHLVIQKDSAMYAIMGTFTAIEDNLQAIKEKENLIELTANSQENIKSRDKKINDDIALIYNMMVQNREKIVKLQEQLRNAKVKNSELQQIIGSLESRIQEKDAEIMRLIEQLAGTNIQIDNLNVMISHLNNTVDSLQRAEQLKDATIEGQDEALNTAYYIIGSESELKQLGILDKRGNFSIGSKKATSDFDKEAFTRIDVRETTRFDLNGAKKIKVVTAHPLDSYTIYGRKPVDSLVINNFYNFWSSSKYLVIVSY